MPESACQQSTLCILSACCLAVRLGVIKDDECSLCKIKAEKDKDVFIIFDFKSIRKVARELVLQLIECNPSGTTADIDPRTELEQQIKLNDAMCAMFSEELESFFVFDENLEDLDGNLPGSTHRDMMYKYFHKEVDKYVHDIGRAEARKELKRENLGPDVLSEDYFRQVTLFANNLFYQPKVNMAVNNRQSSGAKAEEELRKIRFTFGVEAMQ